MIETDRIFTSAFVFFLLDVIRNLEMAGLAGYSSELREKLTGWLHLVRSSKMAS
jgi:hypothetical protein